MIFLGTPRMLVMVKKLNQQIRFNADGEYETDSPKMIKILQRKFAVKPDVEKKSYTCKKCGLEFENIGFLLAHTRAEHKK